MPLSGLMLKAKLLEIHGKVKEITCAFNDSDEWIQKCNKRFGVRLLKNFEEKLSAQPHVCRPFQTKVTNKNRRARLI